MDFILSKMEDTQGQGREFREEKEIKDTEQRKELMGESRMAGIVFKTTGGGAGLKRHTQSPSSGCRRESGMR